MIKDSPVLSKQKKAVVPKSDKQSIQNAILSVSREYIETADGKMITKWDGIVQRMFDIGLFAESNTDAIAASKWLADRILGKANVMKDEEAKPIPKVLFALNETALEDLTTKAQKELPPEQDDYSGCISVQTDDGQEFIV